MAINPELLQGCDQRSPLRESFRKLYYKYDVNGVLQGSWPEDCNWPALNQSARSVADDINGVSLVLTKGYRQFLVGKHVKLAPIARRLHLSDLVVAAFETVDNELDWLGKATDKSYRKLWPKSADQPRRVWEIGQVISDMCVAWARRGGGGGMNDLPPYEP